MKANNSKLLVALASIILFFGSCKNSILPIIDHRSAIIGRSFEDIKSHHSHWKYYDYRKIEIYESRLYRCYYFYNQIEEPYLTNNPSKCNPGNEKFPEIFFTVFKITLEDGNVVYHMTTAKKGDGAINPMVANQAYKKLLKNKMDTEPLDSILNPKNKQYINSILEYTGTQAKRYSPDALKAINVSKKTIYKTWRPKLGKLLAKKTDNVNIIFEYNEVAGKEEFLLENIVITDMTKIGNTKPIIMDIDSLTNFSELRFVKVPARHRGGSILLPVVDKDFK